jgi:Putative transposase/Transposase zinc-binding domain
MATLGEIVREVGRRYLATRATTPFQQKALWSIARCRTEATGADVAECQECGARHVVYRSCGNRSCPGCQSRARRKWLEAREQELLPVPYFHVVFTVPESLNPIALYCPEVFYAALLRSAGNALLEVGRSKLGLELGCLTVLHTWGQNLTLHPHVHCVVPGGGFTRDGEWRSVQSRRYLLPIKSLRVRFRALLCDALRQAAREGKLDRVPGDVAVIEELERVSRKRWIAYAKAPFGGPEQVLRYLANYTHRIAISNGRILSFDGQSVTFKWRDYKDGNRTKYMTLQATEFLRRFLLHVLPDGFVRIRYFGFMSNGRRSRNIERARLQLGCQATSPRTCPAPLVLCPACYAARIARGRLVVRAEAPERPPPSKIAA